MYFFFYEKRQKKKRSTHGTGRSPKVCPHLLALKAPDLSHFSWYKHTLVLLMLVCSFSFLSLFLLVYSCIFFSPFLFRFCTLITCTRSALSIFILIGHLHDGVILLLRPESFSFFLSYLNFVIPVRFK